MVRQLPNLAIPIHIAPYRSIHCQCTGLLAKGKMFRSFRCDEDQVSDTTYFSLVMLPASIICLVAFGPEIAINGCSRRVVERNVRVLEPAPMSPVGS